METTLREYVARALSSRNLQDSSAGETDIDRVRALAHADRLGSYLIRFKDGLDRGALKPAEALLAERLGQSRHRRPDALSIRRRVAACAIQEWALAACQACNGLGRCRIPGTPTAAAPCGRCGGSGRRRFSDADRAEMLGMSVSAAKNFSNRVSAAHALITAAVHRAGVDVAAQLGRVARSSPQRE